MSGRMTPLTGGDGCILTEHRAAMRTTQAWRECSGAWH